MGFREKGMGFREKYVKNTVFACRYLCLPHGVKATQLHRLEQGGSGRE
jgi:hypothetical protein